MEAYPSIGKHIVDTPIYAFDKLDGSNVRAEWTPKKGFMKFGSRRRLLDPQEEPLGEAVGLIQGKYEDDLSRILRKTGVLRATCFFEFHGPSSFAGHHEDEPHDVVLFDVHLFKQGLLPPADFLKLFGKVETPALLHQGKATHPFLEEVRAGTLEGMTFEGVVCKGPLDSRRRPVAFKVKNRAWVERVKAAYGHDPALLEELL